MPVSLYDADPARISAAELLEAVELLLRVNQPVDQRPPESFVLDFKQAWGDKALHTVDAFANTFGGILILGVSEIDGRPDTILGIVEKGEFKTRLASLIASNLTPVPDFNVAVCRLPNDQTRCIAVIRVRPCRDVCLITRKGESNPVYVRVEDKSEPANAAQLRALIEREKLSGRPDSERMVARLNHFNDFYALARKTQGEGFEPSQTFLRVALSPTDHPPIEIDLAVERRFGEAIFSGFAGHESLANNGTALLEWERTRDWTQFALKLNPEAYNYERRWRFYSTGDFGFVTQAAMTIGCGKFWSLYDTAADVVSLMKAATEFWESFGYYGRAYLSVDLRVAGAQVYRGPAGYTALFYDLVGLGFSLDGKVVLRGQKPSQSRGEYQVPLSRDSLTTGRVYTVSCALNQLLRSFGLLSDLQELEQALRASLT